MSQLSPNQYKRLTAFSPTYGQSDGLYWDLTNSKLVLVLANAVVAGFSASAATAGELLVGDGSTMSPAAPSGDVTVNGSGVFAIGANKVLSAMLSPLAIKYATISLNATQASALNGSPQTVVAAPGAGYVTLVHRALAVLNYSGGAITANGIVGLYETNSAGQAITGTLTLASFLGAGADVIKTLQPVDSATTGTTRLDNKAIVLSQATGDSTKGSSTSTVDVHCWYSVIPHGL